MNRFISKKAPNIYVHILHIFYINYFIMHNISKYFHNYSVKFLFILTTNIYLIFVIKL